MNHLFVINPKAGKNPDPYRLRVDIESVMKQRGEPYSIRFTERVGHATHITRDAVSDRGDWRVYACGGDGTLNEVVNGIAGFDNAAMTQIACGTGNDFLRLFNPDDNSLFRDVSVLVDGEERKFDLIESSDRFSLNICSVGFDARVASDVHKFSKLPFMTSTAAFTTSALYHLTKGLSHDYTVEVNGENMDGRYALICIANARFYGGGYMPMGDANPTDGVLDVLLIKDIPRPKVLTMISKYKSGRYEELGDVAIRRAATEIKIGFSGRNEAVNYDGEVFPSEGGAFKLSDKKLRFFAPKNSFTALDNPVNQSKA